jgi:hypothetical protein
MKNNLVKIYIVAFYLCSTFVVIAQPGDDNAGGDLEGTGGDSTPVPLDEYVWVLVLVGLAYAILKIRAMYKQQFRSEE